MAYSAFSYCIEPVLVSVPSVVPVFQMIERGSHHMKLAWEKPDEPNGILLGYDIEYRKGLLNFLLIS